MPLFEGLLSATHALAELPEWRANELVHRHGAKALVGFALLVVLCVLQHAQLDSARALAESSLDEWRAALEGADVERRAEMARVKPLENKARVAALRQGANGTQAWVTTLQRQHERTEATFSDLQRRVDGGLAMVRDGWWEGEGHFRLFHTHNRGSSPLVRMCLPVSITTRGTRWVRLEEMLLLTSLLPSLLRTMEPGFLYGVYVGYDAGDPLLDAVGAEARLQSLWSSRCAAENKRVELKLFRYNDTRNHNVWAVNYITKEAYLDGYDYFFRINDDSEFQMQGWTSRLVEALQLNEDFGAAGVLDSANPRIWTHSIVARPHVEIFGFHFPFSFGNWWSDDWITFAYTHRFSFWLYDIDIYHHRHPARYDINWDDHETRLRVELDRSQVRWRQWLCKTRELEEFCAPMDPHREALLSDVPFEPDTRGALPRDRLLAMESQARAEQFVRLANVSAAAKKSK